MNLLFDLSLSKNYHSKSQIARILTESWVEQNMFCPRCGCLRLMHYENNRPVADFYCDNCGSDFELKSKNGVIGDTVVDGAYATMITKITERKTPDFMFMSYSMKELCVTNLMFIPKHFFVPSVIEKRKPLGEKARRAGWTGCNIRLDRIPRQGRVAIISNGIAASVSDTVRCVDWALRLDIRNVESRGWLFDVLNCINTIPNEEFTLNDMYQFEPILAQLYPDNCNIRAKIRQQLQRLREKGFISFLGRGYYRKTI